MNTVEELKVDIELVEEVLNAVADDIVSGVVSYDNVDDTIVIVADDVAVEFYCEQVDTHGEEDTDGYSYYSYTYVAFVGRDNLFEVNVFVYNNGDIILQEGMNDSYQLTIKEVA